jgi:ABC-type antimicrobial peptide transport system permease subunit
MGQPVTNIQIRSGSELFAEVTALPRHRTQLLTILGGLGLVLAMVGVFGMTAYSVARRTREVGIRMAFGARPTDAVLAIVRDAAAPLAAGVGLGLLVAYLIAPVLGSFLFQTAPRDPVAFGSAALALAVAGLLAAWIPARHAARVNPVEALRAE